MIYNNNMRNDNDENGNKFWKERQHEYKIQENLNLSQSNNNGN